MTNQKQIIQKEIKIGEWCYYEYPDKVRGIFKYAQISRSKGLIISTKGLGVDAHNQPFDFNIFETEKCKFKKATKKQIDEVFKIHNLSK